MKEEKDKKITEEDIEQYLKEITLDLKESTKEYVIFQHCIHQGFIKRSSIHGLKICGDPNCLSCKDWMNTVGQYKDISKKIDDE